jgi:hypothetical protein
MVRHFAPADEVTDLCQEKDKKSKVWLPFKEFLPDEYHSS